MIGPKKTESNHLTRKQREAIPHLIGARSLEEGRRKAKVSKCALYLWLKNDAFQKELTDQREAVIRDALERLKASVGQAVERLVELLNADSQSIQLRASEGILNFFLRARELEELTDRVAAIERVISRGGLMKNEHFGEADSKN